ncbi:MAG: glycosyltransferase [Thermosynechococcaceae cyanobacterium]
MPSRFNLPMSPSNPHTNQVTRPVRILHVVGRMDRAGLETWLMRVLRLIDRQQFQIDIVAHSPEPGAYDAEIQALGCRILPCAFPFRPWAYGKTFQQILAEQGPYDIVHSHVHFFSGYVLKLAKDAQVPCRIAHSHNDHSTVEQHVGWQRKAYLFLMKRWIRRFATHGLATSPLAALDLFGPDWSRDPRIQVLYCGLDLTPFATAVAPAPMRQTWGIPTDACVIGHVGRFEAQKNHSFLVQVAAVAMSQHPNLYLMLVGQGALQPAIAQQVQALGIGDRVIFAGAQSDIPRLLLEVFDLFLFPSLHEGLGVALLEAQAAGLPCLIADTVPPEADIIPPLVKRLSLTQTPAQWADALLVHRQSTPRWPVSATLPLLWQSPFNMENSVPPLVQLYSAQI